MSRIADLSHALQEITAAISAKITRFKLEFQI